MKLSKGLIVLATVAACGSAFGDVFDYVSWTASGAASSAAGTVDGISVGVAGPVLFVQGAAGTNYINGYPNTYESALVSNMPAAADLIGMTGGTTNGVADSYTISFSQAVYNPIFDWVSLGNGSNPVTINYNQNISLLSEGPGWWGGSYGATTQSGNSITGYEGDGTVLVPGWVSSVTFTAPNSENWYGFQIGIDSTGPSTPSPAAVLPFAIGLIGTIKRRKRS